MSLNILIISQLQGLNPSPVPKHSRLYHLWLFRKGYREGHALLGCSAKGRSHPTEEGPPTRMETWVPSAKTVHFAEGFHVSPLFNPPEF